MKAAARLAPRLSSALRPVARAPVAGPSSLRLSSTSASAPSPAPIAADSAHTHATPAPAADASLPQNLAFEDLTSARAQVRLSLLSRGEVLHALPSDPYEPIAHPLSSLASATPTSGTARGVSLPAEVFGQPLRKDILHRNVVWYLSTLRQGTQHTRTRATVAYSGKKISPQKGTGRARVGDRSSGTRRGGAPIFPLHNRDHAQDLPRKVRELGLRTALSSKLAGGLLRVVENLNEGQWPGTNVARRALSDDKETLRFGPPKDISVLFVHSPFKPTDEVNEFWRVVRNIPGIELLPTDEVVAYDILKYRWVVLEAGAVDALSGDSLEFEFEAPEVEELEFADVAQPAAAEAAKA
ncbi:50S ribosomal protein L4 [Vanrija pseudolonga]|uniref:Large ribosomal subunit protein uL4m n=1 Tax=Vanrija pseudolonga TaxID=143232 RepID=A0AAF0YDK9_9TREE|nr:50S ribosomal protein L4 [Vanrija pseudolonga]